MKYLKYFFMIILIIVILCISFYNGNKNIRVENFESKNDSNRLECKYVSSYQKKPNCPPKFKNYSGATFGARDTELYCNGDIIKNEKAVAEAVISNGTIKEIKILNKGSNYIKKPRVHIIAKENDIIWNQKNGIINKKGVNGKAEAIVKNNKIEEIIIKNAGSYYYTEPEIIIDNPDGVVYCHLCCN